jgi:hypothetical protein
MKEVLCNRIAVVIMATLLVVGCGTVPVTVPLGMMPMEEAANGPELVQKFFPGHAGKFYVASQAGAGPVFGLIYNQEEPGKAFLAGAGAERSWSEPLPLESSAWKVVSFKPEMLAVGDVREDGTTELLVQVMITSKGREGDGTLTRRAVYLYELAKRASLVWYQSLMVEGAQSSGCAGGAINYKATVSYGLDAERRLEKISTAFESNARKCKGGKECKEGKRECQQHNDKDTLELIWDDELRSFKPVESNETILKVPDVSL